MSCKRKDVVSFTIRYAGLLLILLVFIAAGKSIKVSRETQGREGPGPFYKLVTVIPEGKSMEVTGRDENWYKVTYEDKDIWISENSIILEKEKVEKDVFESLSLDNVSAKASPATITAAIKGFWTRYSRTQGKNLTELPVDGYDIPVESYKTFTSDRSRTVDREKLFRKYRIKSSHRKHKIPYEREQSIGYTCVSAVADAPLVKQEDIIQYIYSVGWYIAESTERYDMHFTYYILDTDRINAVSAPGGYIVLTKGLLNLLHDESELAALLSHEMAHIIAGHGMLQVIEDKIRIKADSAFDTLNRETEGSTDVEEELIAITNRAVSIAQSPKLDEYEFEADKMALRYLASCGYDLRGLLRLLHSLDEKHGENIDIFDLNYRNHPDFKERMKRVEKELEHYKNYKGNNFKVSFEKIMVQ